MDKAPSKNTELIHSDSYCIENCRIVLEDGVLEGKKLLVHEGKIREILPPNAPVSGCPVYDGEGGYLVPGFVELHIHGCGDLGVENVLRGDKDVLEQMGGVLARMGVNTFVPTLPFDIDVIAGLADELCGKPQLSRKIPGLYVEGPFVEPKRRGGIPESFIHSPDTRFLEEILQAGRGKIRLMTFAPELPGAGGVAEKLVANGVIPCVGHSDALPEDVPALPGGEALNITHLFNGMSPFSHKKPGLSMLPFLDETVFFELNGDGIHVNDETLRTCYRHLNRERMILISDAVISAGLGYGEYGYFDKDVVSDSRGVRYLKSGVLIGSNMLLPQVANHFSRSTGAPLHEVIRMICGNPCRLLGLEDRGVVAPGKRADLLVVDERFQVLYNFQPETN